MDDLVAGLMQLMYRLWVVLKDLPRLLFAAQLLDAFSLQVSLLAFLKQRVGPAVSAEELRGSAPAQD